MCHPVLNATIHLMSTKASKYGVNLTGHLVQSAVYVPGGGRLQVGRGDVEGALDVVEVAAAHSLRPTGTAHGQE